MVRFFRAGRSRAAIVVALGEIASACSAKDVAAPIGEGSTRDPSANDMPDSASSESTAPVLPDATGSNDSSIISPAPGPDAQTNWPSAASRCLPDGDLSVIEGDPDCAHRPCGDRCVVYDDTGQVISVPGAFMRCDHRQRCLPTRD